MDKFISFKELIKVTKKEGIDLGKGNPYNRLRYYTKMGWLPHMTRITNEKGDIEGHYPAWAINTLRRIQEFKNEGLTNEQIEQKVKMQNNFQRTFSAITYKDNKNRLIIYSVIIIVVIILLIESNVLGVNKQNKYNTDFSANIATNVILDSGTAIVPKSNKSVFIKTNKVNNTSKINVTFKSDYSPASRYWIAEIINNEGFNVEMDTPIAEDSEFSWFISN